MNGECQCPIAGYCETHKRRMSAARHRQCRDEPGYFEAFAYAAGKASGEPSKPCTGCERRKAAMNSILPGSGDAVEKITEKTGLKSWWENRA